MYDLLSQLEQMRIETERIRLRPFTETDFSDFFEYVIQKELQRLSGNPNISTEKEARELFDNMLVKNGYPIRFAIELKAISKVIGNFSINHYPFWEEGDVLKNKIGVSLSFVLNENYWRRGIMTEVLKNAIEWLFTVSELEYVNAGFFLFNKASEKLQRKVGMKPYRKHIITIGGKEIETQEMIILKKEKLEYM